MYDPTMRDRSMGRADTATADKKAKDPADHRLGRKD
jgi:hypothetical protein